MSSELIDIIENLNPRSFDDYKYLAFELRQKINELIKIREEETKKEKEPSQKTLQKRYIKQTSINFIVDKFNIKLLQYVNIFFFNEELIRDVFQKKPSIEQEIWGGHTFKLSYIFYIHRFHELGEHFKPTLGPPEINPKRGMDFDASLKYRNILEERFKNKYYVSPKPYKDSNSKNCFIATYAYDSSENENVVLLRSYRDLVLLQSKLGIRFVNLYYKFSPSLVIFFKQIKFPKRLLRLLLNIIVKLIKKSFRRI